MKDQINTIRKFIEHCGVSAKLDALDALTQLEAMVGEQEPVAWQRRMKPVWGDRDYLWSPWEECSEGTAEDCWKTPLLHEWAYEARALYTAVPVDQRPRAKDIGEADLDPDEGDPVTLWAEIWRLREAVKGPDGYATWQDAATAERIRRVRAESKHAAPVAQQYEAGDMASAAAQGFRDGVAPVAQQPQATCKTCGRRMDDPAVIHGPNGCCPAQQPQAEPDDEILKERDDAEDFIDMLLDEVLGTDRPEWTSAYGRDDALRDVQERMTALHKPTVDKAWARFEKAQRPQAEAVPQGWGEHEIAQAAMEAEIPDSKLESLLLALPQRVTQPQAEAVLRCPDSIDGRHDFGPDGGRCAGETCTAVKPFAAPQQAEAAPPDVEVIRKALERAFIMGQNYWADADSESYSANKRSDVTRQKFNAMRDEVCVAIAQQKGQP